MRDGARALQHRQCLLQDVLQLRLHQLRCLRLAAYSLRVMRVFRCIVCCARVCRWCVWSVCLCSSCVLAHRLSLVRGCRQVDVEDNRQRTLRSEFVWCNANVGTGTLPADIA